MSGILVQHTPHAQRSAPIAGQGSAPAASAPDAGSGECAASGVSRVAVPEPAAITPHPQFLHVFSRLTNCQGGTAAIPAISGAHLAISLSPPPPSCFLSSPAFLHLAPKNVLISKCFL